MKGAVRAMKDDDGLSKEEKKYYKNHDGKYRAEEDVRCMMSYQEMKKDKARYEAAMYCLRMKKKAIDRASKEMKSKGDYEEE